MTHATAGTGWLKITIESDPALVDSISDFLIGIFEAGVESPAPDESDYGRIVAYLEKTDPNEQEQKEITATLEDHLKGLAEIFSVPLPRLTAEMIAWEDWGKKWKSHFKPFAILPQLIIVPSWEKYQAREGEHIITMDPGMAFGTGHHATTALSLEFIREICQREKDLSLLDVGTGTGILGMAALLFSVNQVYGIDNDPEAVAAARKNIRVNGFEDKMSVDNQPLEEIKEAYHIVVANIVHDVLLELSGELARLTTQNGHLVLSGILCNNQLQNIKTHFTSLGFSLEDEKCCGEWAAVHLMKKNR